jgi:NAD-dependent DNA ligase
MAENVLPTFESLDGLRLRIRQERERRVQELFDAETVVTVQQGVITPAAARATVTHRAQALVDAGIHDLKAIYDCPSAKLSEILGPKTGASLYKNIRDILPKTDELTFMVASSLMRRGVGESKLETIFKMEPNPIKWTIAMKPLGWTPDSLAYFLECIPAYMEWRQKNLAWIPFPSHPNAPRPEAVITANTKFICISGFRDAAFEEQVRSKGHIIVPSISGKTNILIISDETKGETEKMKEAVKRGIPIFKRSLFVP